MRRSLAIALGVVVLSASARASDGATATGFALLQAAISTHLDAASASLALSWRTLAAAPDELARFGDTFARVLGTSEALRATTQGLILLLVGLGAEWLYWCYAFAARRRLEASEANSAMTAFRLAGRRLGIDLAAIAIFLGCLLGASAAFAWPPGIQGVVIGLALAASLVRAIQALSRFLIAPRAATLRLVALDGASARRAHVLLIAIAAAVALESVVRGVLGPALDLPALALALRVVAITIAAALVIALILQLRGAESPDAGESATRGGAGLASFLAVALVVVTYVLWLAGFDRLARSAIAFGGFVVVDWIARHVGGRLRRASSADAAPAASVVAVYRPVLERLARLVLLLVVFAIVLAIWGVELLSLAQDSTPTARIANGVASVVIVALLADVLWVWARTAIDARVPQLVDGDLQSSTSRLGTLLPLMRKFLLVVLLIVVVLTALSAMGVEIGPLLAGAGIVGIALGFGAQTLVKDIISGVFFLLDDAFRVGEYIESGRIRGTVESFSLRSVKLRHHRGALHTLPFGELRSITNYSRDWVIDKITFGVTYDTDLDKLKKIVKQVSKELMADEEIARVVIEPLKSQGVSKLGDFAIEIRLKVKTKPGEQFIVRRALFPKLKKAFDANGIHFAFPTVTVAGGDPGAAAAHAVTRAREPSPSTSPG